MEDDHADDGFDLVHSEHSVALFHLKANLLLNLALPLPLLFLTFLAPWARFQSIKANYEMGLLWFWVDGGSQWVKVDASMNKEQLCLDLWSEKGCQQSKTLESLGLTVSLNFIFLLTIIDNGTTLDHSLPYRSFSQATV